MENREAWRDEAIGRVFGRVARADGTSEGAEAEAEDGGEQGHRSMRVQILRGDVGPMVRRVDVSEGIRVPFCSSESSKICVSYF